MGGCRCTFSECDSSTSSSPGMHFFHFPVRDFNRCERWAYFSNNMDYLKLPLDKLKNKVICEKHFLDPCFMNLKKERLIKSAVPTLLVLKSGEVVDLELTQTNSVVEYITPNATEEVPKILKPVILNNRKRPFIHNGTSTKEYADKITLGLTLTTDHTDADITELPLKMPKFKPKTFLASSKNVKVIENKILNSTIASPAINNIKFPTIKNEKKNIAENNNKNNLQNSSIETINFIEVSENKLLKKELIDAAAVKIIEPKSSAASSSLSTPKTSFQMSNIPNIVNLKSLEFLNEQPSTSLITTNNIETIDKTLFIEKTTEHQNQLTQIKELIVDMMNKCENTLNVKSQIETDKSKFNMNKIQLFNAIKKYLNPAMVSLLRMELFGTNEREWKTDEKLFAIELCKLGTNTYEYFRDEWRFRLPPKKDVEKWINDNAEFHDEDDLEC